MKLIFVPDSFKGSLTSSEVCEILEAAAKRHFPGAELLSVPVADGGEGTVDALLHALGGHIEETEVTGPLFEKETARFGLSADGQTAILEMAQASGLPYVPQDKRDPRNTTSLGTGEMLAQAMKMGARKILLGIGGSATNDCGIGMLTALGAVFTDAKGNQVPPVGGNLAKVCHIDFSGLLPELRETEITVICDVTNPLLGENGATCVYGPQKGATERIRDELERGMAHFASLVRQTLGRDIASFPGAGAAGGLGAALGGILGAALRSGIDAVLDAADFEKKLEGASLVVTGEGRMDVQSVRFGKVPAGIARRCAARGIPVLVLVGGMGKGAEEMFDLCESTVMPIVSGPMPLSEAMENAHALCESAADRLFRAVRIGMELKC